MSKESDQTETAPRELRAHFGVVATMATKAFQIGQECRPTHSRMPKSRKLRPMSPVEAERFHPGQLRQARMLMVQLELMPTAKKTTPGHCG